MSVRRATPDDSYTIARLRQAMWDEMRPDDPADRTFREATFVFWYEALESGRAVGWIAEVDGQAVGITMLLLHDHPPRPFGQLRRGYVTSVYVTPAYRRQGHGKALMQAAIAYGREQGLQRLELRTSPVGRALYESVGFEAVELLIKRLDQ